MRRHNTSVPVTSLKFSEIETRSKKMLHLWLLQIFKEKSLNKRILFDSYTQTIENWW